MYRGEDAKPYSLPVVTSVEIAMASDKTLNHEYLPISGLKDFCEAATKLALGSESTAIVENRVSALFLGVGPLRGRCPLKFYKKVKYPCFAFRYCPSALGCASF